MAKFEQAGDQPIGQARDPGLDRLHTDRIQSPQTALDCSGCSRKFRVPSSNPASPARGNAGALNGHEIDRAAAEPGALEFRQRRLADEKAADAGRIAEHLVERDDGEVGRRRLEVEPVRRREGGGVEQHMPAALAGAREWTTADA